MDLINRIRMWFRTQPPALRAILIINVAMYLLYQLVLVYVTPVNNFIAQHLALNPALPGVLLEPWQLITYAFLHTGFGWGGFFHVLFNMLWLVWIGRDLEHTYGSHRFLAVFMISAVAGAVLVVALHALFPGSSLFGGPVVGASGGVYGVLMAAATFQPQRTIGLLFIGTVRLIHIVIGLLFLDLLFLRGGGTAVAAHWGGVLAGFAFARAEASGTNLSSWARGFFDRSKVPSRPRSTPASGGSFLQRLENRLSEKERRKASKKGQTARVHELHPEKKRKSEKSAEVDVDTLLDKISEYGYDALTDEEKRALLNASKK